jgi:hypothetical protein
MVQPEQRFQSGGVVASIWDNEIERDGQVTSFKSVSFGRNYKDKEGKWQTTNSLKASDLPRAIMVLGKAFEHLSLKHPAN